MSILKVLVGIAFLIAGSAKLVGVKPLADQFEEFGLPRGMMVVVGVLELAGAISLFIKDLASWAAIGLVGLMIGAVANHLKARHKFDKLAPSIVLLVLTAVLGFTLWHANSMTK